MTTQPSSTSNSHPTVIFDRYTPPSPLSKRSGPSRWGNALQGIQHWAGEGFKKLLMAAIGSSEPIVQHRIYKGGDRHGQSYYTIYDPVTHQRTRCSSEAEVREWLEQRYYQ